MINNTNYNTNYMPVLFLNSCVQFFTFKSALYIFLYFSSDIVNNDQSSREYQLDFTKTKSSKFKIDLFVYKLYKIQKINPPRCFLLKSNKSVVG